MKTIHPALLAALLLMLLSIAPARAEDQRLAELNLRLWPSPSSATRGDIVRYDLTVENTGEGKASRTRVTLPYPKGQFSIAKVELPQRTSWVMELADDKIVVMFGTLRSGEKREARIFVTVGQGAAPDGQPIRLRAFARYDQDEGQRVRSNETSLTIIGAEADTRPAVVVEPAMAPAGAVFRFSVRNYFPEEKLFTWINAPGSVLPSGIVGLTSEQGAAVIELQSERLDLKPGLYSFVILGDSSKVTTVTPFEVK